MKVRQHIPNFADVERDPDVEITVGDTQALLGIPFVSRWRTKDFLRFSVSRSDYPVLMAEMKDGSFWVVAFLEDAEGLQLPEWKYPGK